MPDLPELPEVFDFSHGSTNPYKIEARHGFLRPCLYCHRLVPVILDGTEYWAYFVQGERIAQACPSLSLPERELLITGTHPQCWDLLMGPEE